VNQITSHWLCSIHGMVSVLVLISLSILSIEDQKLMDVDHHEKID